MEGTRWFFDEFAKKNKSCFSLLDKRKKKEKTKTKRSNTMNDVAPPLYGSGNLAVVAASHHPPQQRSEGTKLFELEPVRERVERRETEREAAEDPPATANASASPFFFSLFPCLALSLFLSKPIQNTPGARASCRDSPWTCGHRRGEWRKLGKKNEDDIRSSNSPTSFFGRPLLSPLFPPLLTSPRLDSSSPARPRSSAPSSSSESAARSPGAAPSPSSPGRARPWPSLRHLLRARSSSTEVRARRRRWARRSRPPSR